MKSRLRVSRTEFEELLRPRLMLFLSADIENSTRLKQRGGERKWVGGIVEFIHEFPAVFQAERERQAAALENAPPEFISPWKILGDEILFALEVTHEAQPVRELSAYRRALRRWNDLQDEKTGKPVLTVKGTAWLAGFPVANAMLPVAGDGGRQVMDYIGPSMDAGFRLGKTATSRRLILSVETAWWILRHNAGEDMETGALRFQGCHEHKGLAEETGYPLIWMELRPSEYQRLEDQLLGRVAARDQSALRELCAAFILEFGVPRHLPFLFTLEGLEAIRRCPGFQENLVAARDEMLNILFVDDDGAPPAGPAAAAASDEAMRLLDRIPPG